MDITKTINNILYTLEHYPVPEDLEWSTEQVLTLISRIKELEEEREALPEDKEGKMICKKENPDLGNQKDWKEWIDKRPRSPVYEE